MCGGGGRGGIPKTVKEKGLYWNWKVSVTSTWRYIPRKGNQKSK